MLWIFLLIGFIAGVMAGIGIGYRLYQTDWEDGDED